MTGMKRQGEKLTMGNGSKRCKLVGIGLIVGLAAVWPLAAQEMTDRRATHGFSRQDPSASPRMMNDDASAILEVHVVNPSGGHNLPPMVHVALFRGDRGTGGQNPDMDGYCDRKGYFSFSGLNFGSYTVAVNVPGYLPQRFIMDMSRGDHQELNVQLRRAPGAAAADAGDTVSMQQLGVPEKARQKYNKGSELLEKKDYTGALKQAQQALEIDSDYAAAHNLMGLANWNLAKYDDAKQSFQNAMRSDPKFLAPYLNLAQVLEEQKDYAPAAALLRQAAELQPYSAEPYYLLGKMQLETGNTEHADWP